MKREIYIGIDGGGTHSTAVAVYTDGTVAAVAEGGGQNFYNDGVEEVKTRLYYMVKELLKKCPDASIKQVCVGSAALDQEADIKTRAQFAGDIIPLEKLDLQSDAYIALMGSTTGEPGIIVICGTGSMVLMRDSLGACRAAGGWGYLLGDAGSGYTLAREGLKAAIKNWEGLLSAPMLAEAAMGFFELSEPRRLIEKIYDPSFTTHMYAGFAKCVIDAANRGDPTALGIITENMKTLARITYNLLKTEPSVNNIGLYGGIFKHSPKAKKAFTEEIQSLAPEVKVGFPKFTPEIGAVIHSMKKDSILTESVLKNIENTYNK